MGVKICYYIYFNFWYKNINFNSNNIVKLKFITTFKLFFSNLSKCVLTCFIFINACSFFLEN